MTKEQCMRLSFTPPPDIYVDVFVTKGYTNATLLKSGTSWKFLSILIAKLGCNHFWWKKLNLPLSLVFHGREPFSNKNESDNYFFAVNM